MRDYIIVALLLALVAVAYVAVDQREDYLVLRQQHNATVEHGQRRERLIQAQVRALDARPVIYRTRTVYRELP